MAKISVSNNAFKILQLADGRKDIYQWDKNLRLKILGTVPEGSQVHYSSLTDDNENALVVKTYTENGNTYANIPNMFLLRAEQFKAYLYVVDGDCGYTKEEINLEPTAREKPDDYIYTETEILNYETLFKMIEDKMAELEAMEARVREFANNYIKGILSMVDTETGETYEVYIANGELLMNKLDT